MRGIRQRAASYRYVAFYGVVGGVDLCRYALGTDSLLRVRETIRVEALDQLSAFPVHFFHGCAGDEAEPVVGGQDVWRVFPGGKCGGRGPPSRGPFCSRRFCGAALLRLAPLLGGAFPGCFERSPQDLTTLAAGTEPFPEALVFLQAGDKTLGEAPQAARDAHCSFSSLVSK